MKKKYRRRKIARVIDNMITLAMLLFIAAALVFIFTHRDTMGKVNAQVDYKTWAPDGYTVTLEEVRASKGDTIQTMGNELIVEQGLEGVVCADKVTQAILKLNPEVRDPNTDFQAGELYTVPVYTLEETTGN